MTRRVIMKRSYEYVIYRLYSWRLEKNNDTPEATVIFTLSFVHLIQIGIIFLIAIKIMPTFQLTNFKKFAAVIGFALLYYLFIYNKKRWLGYIEKFKDETPEQRKKGTFFVRLFTLGSVILFFVTAVVILFISR